jgi:5'(3')-deoxyribonucleotidase
MTNNIYIDMDGVVADFNVTAMHYLNANTTDLEQTNVRGRWPTSEWEKLKTIPNFYRILPKTPFADQIIALARRFRDELGWNLYMLTAIPKDNDMPDCFYDKFLWMQEYYSDIPVRFGPYSYDKQKHAKPGDILVDDRVSNCKEWTDAGGDSYLISHQNYETILETLTNKLITLKNRKTVLEQIILD